MGAVKAFGWTLGFSFILFCWRYALYIAILAIGGAGATFERFKR
jgi:hypothetical protein